MYLISLFLCILLCTIFEVSSFRTFAKRTIPAQRRTGTQLDAVLDINTGMLKNHQYFISVLSLIMHIYVMLL